MTDKEALESARMLYEFYKDIPAKAQKIIDAFPELAESEDEKTRKLILDTIFHAYGASDECNAVRRYLEKHKEQPAERGGEQNAAIEIVCDVLLNDYGPGEKLPCCTGGYWDVSRDYLIARLKSLRSQPKQKWSEEDERNIETIVDIVHRSYAPFDTIRYDYPINCEALLSWLKSLRPQPKQKWSEEDEAKKERLISIVKRALHGNEYPLLNDDGATELITWLKSLRPQPHWKPSEEQMEALEMASRKWFGEDSVRNLSALYEDLKKL